MFSFFKKKGSGPERPRTPEQRPAPKPSAPELDVDPHRTLDSIEVSDSESGLSRLAEEAAILYANGRTDAAIEILLPGVAEGGVLRRSPLAWFMLFDLFQLQGMKQQFERLALDFVVEFERSAPVWMDSRAAGQAPGGGVAERGRVPVVLAGALSRSSERQIADMEAAVVRDGELRLDLGKLHVADAAGCALLRDSLERIRAAGHPMDIVGAHGLEKLLRREIEAGGRSCPPEFMLLLLKLYQLQGMATEFENLSLDYAVAYEVSPPPWEPPVARKAAQPAAQYAVEAGGDQGVEALRVRGSMLGPNPPQLIEIVNYAASHPIVNIDMSEVPRVDFLAAGALLNAFMSLAQRGKGIMMHGANEMIQALFTIVGINRYVVVTRNKQH